MAEGVATPDGVRVTGAPAGSTPGFQRPPEVPWSELGPEFIETWGHDEAGKLRAEHLEVMGQSGSGKSYSIATILQERAARWNTAELAILTKQADDSIPLLGWPVIDSYRDLSRYSQAVFWPQTSALGEQRSAYMEARIYELLSHLWQPAANCVLYFDEIGFVEDLSRRLKKMTQMYWREGRSHGISIVASKQRPVGINRDAHSESRWKIVFPPADSGDMDRFADMLGRKRDWAPVLESLDQTQHQFILRNSFTKDAYISWMDGDLKPLPSQVEQKEHASTPYGRDQRKTEGER